MYDIEQIKNTVSGPEIVDHFGLETKKMGSLISILCPFHDDEHYGSCYVYDKGIHCYVCDHSWDVIEFTQDMLGCSFVDALKYLSENFGIAAKDSVESCKFRLSIPEMECLGLYKENRNPNWDVKGISFVPPGPKIKCAKWNWVNDQETVFVLYNKGQSMRETLDQFSHENPREYYNLLVRKGKEAYSTYEKLCLKTGRLYLETGSPAAYGLYSYYKSQYDLCRKVLYRLNGERERRNLVV